MSQSEMRSVQVGPVSGKYPQTGWRVEVERGGQGGLGDGDGDAVDFGLYSGTA